MSRGRGGRRGRHSGPCSGRFPCDACDTRRRQAESEERERNDFGNGEVRGDNSWTSPVYGATEDGQDVTVSFGQGSRDGHTGITSGHVERDEYYSQGGHDHYGRNGESHRDSGRYQD